MYGNSAVGMRGLKACDPACSACCRGDVEGSHSSIANRAIVSACRQAGSEAEKKDHRQSAARL